jgi:hypothetical protein
LRVRSTPWPLLADQVAARNAHVDEPNPAREAALEPGEVVVLLDLDVASQVFAFGDDERDAAGGSADDGHDVRAVTVPAAQV